MCGFQALILIIGSLYECRLILTVYWDSIFITILMNILKVFYCQLEVYLKEYPSCSFGSKNKSCLHLSKCKISSVLQVRKADEKLAMTTCHLDMNTDVPLIEIQPRYLLQATFI